MKKIKMLVIPSDRSGCGLYRSVSPHTYIAEHYPDEFDVDIVYNMPKGDLESFLKQYDLIHIHKQLDSRCQIIDMIKFLGIPVIVDVDDYYLLGNDHPMSLTAKKERWHEPIVNHLKKADYVTTTTPIYAEVLRKLNKNVAVFPNAIDEKEEQFAVPKTEGDGRLRVGIICGSSHLKDLQLIDGIARQVNTDKVQFVLCGFDTRGTRTIYNQQTGEQTTRPIQPEESVWCEYEKIFTDNYKNISQPHKDFLMKYVSGVDDPFTNEPYRRMWTRDINHYATHYSNVDVLIAPLRENDFNKMKCIVGESLISTNKGVYKISDIVDNKLNLKINVNGELKNIINYFKYNNEKTIRITTSCGYEIEGTPTHRIMINGEWVKLGDLKIGDKIGLERPTFDAIEYQELSYPMLLTKNTECKIPLCSENMIPKITINEKWGRFFGYMLGDGCYKSNGVSISCDKRYDDVVNDVTNLISSMGLKPIKKEKLIDKRCKTSRIKGGFGIDIVSASKTLRLIAEKYNLHNENGKVFHVPEFIFKSPKSVIKEFLKGLFESDGTVGENSRVSFTTKSFELAKEIQYLLLGFGITCKLGRNYNKYYNKYYFHLELRKSESQIFKKEIGFISQKKNEKLEIFCSRKNSNHHVEMNMTDEISLIEESKADVYDIEVEDVHLFNSNGFISHNSQLKETECGFTKTAFIGQNFGAYTIDTIPMIEKGGVINENGNCLLVDPRKNHKDWARYINRLADDREMLKKLQDNLEKHVKENYSLEKICKERVELYKKIVNGE